MGKYMSCEKMARCTLDECDPKTFEGYKYNQRSQFQPSKNQRKRSYNH